MKFSRTAAAFVCAPLIVPVAVWILSRTKPNLSAEAIPFIAGVATITAYAGMLLLGVPAVYFLRSKGWTAWWIAVVWGGFCGAVAYTLCNLFFFWLLNGERLDLELKATFDVFLLFPIVAGAMVGILFWFIARPDRKPVS